MKKINKLTLKSLSVFVGIIGVVLFVFSCAKDGTDQNRNTVFGNCANCGAIAGGQPFFQSQSNDSMYGMSLSLSFIGNIGSTPYSYNQYNSSINNPIISYNGAVAALGQLNLTQPVGVNHGSYNPQYSQQYGGCYLPAGAYSVGTMQAGQWSNAMISGLILTATGPANVILKIPQAQVAAKTGSQLGTTWNQIDPSGRLFGNLIIQSVNGINCQISTMIQ